MRAQEIAKRLEVLGYDDNGGGPYKNMPGSAEMMLHEHAHATVLGGGVEPRDIERTIDGLSDVAADWNEVRTLAVETLAARVLGLRVSTKVLAKYASGPMRTSQFGDHNVIRRTVEKLLTTKSCQRLARQIVADIEGAL